MTGVSHNKGLGGGPIVAMNPQSLRYAPDQDTQLFDSALLGNSSAGNSTLAPETSTAFPPNTTEIPVLQPPCQWLLNKEIDQSRVRIWDVIILLPNALFLAFLLLRFRTAMIKLQRTNSPIFLAFYGMVFLVAVISVLRCVVSMTVNAAMTAGDIADKVLWLTVRFFLLATELSVVIFGLAFGHLDSRTSIQRVLLVTCTIALLYSSTQGVLEFLYPDTRFHVKNDTREYDIFAHGGMLFWFASSLFFFVVYTVICILPWTKLRSRFALPSKISFYIYCLFLACLNATQAVGSCLLYYNVDHGMCVVDATTFIYFTCFAPLVYVTFLRDFFKNSQPPSILFSYKAQVDVDEDEDTVSLPHQSSNNKPDTDMMSTSYDSTHFDAATSPNPLYGEDVSTLDSQPQLALNSDY